jgi:acylphosphatase
MDLTRRLSITGRVQGVGFRYSLHVEARARGVRGWVRNRRDGSVEALLQGETAAVEAVTAWARRGPAAARVDRVELLPEGEEAVRCYAGFEQLPTA